MDRIPIKKVHPGMMLETEPMPGTRRAEALERSEVPTVVEAIGGVRKIPRFVLLAIVGAFVCYTAWVIISIAVGA